MKPKIPDGSYCVFRPVPAGSKEGRILLFQHHDIDDPETGGRYTREIEFDDEGNEKKQIVLEPLNSNFNKIVMKSGDEDYESQIQVIDEFVRVY